MWDTCITSGWELQLSSSGCEPSEPGREGPRGDCAIQLLAVAGKVQFAKCSPVPPFVYAALCRHCFERKGVTSEHQLSDPPLLTDTDVVWRKVAAGGDVLKFDAPDEGKTARAGFSAGDTEGALPMSKCPDR